MLQILEETWATSYPTVPLLVFTGDLSKRDSCYAWGEFLSEQGKPLGALVNNLGTFTPGTLLEGPAEQLENMLNTNLLSAHHLTRACMPLLRQAEMATIVTIGSVATTDWPPPLAAYALSKYALEGWHRQLRRELAESAIRTTLLRPGATFTSSWDGIDVDPAQLLSAERVAELATQAILLPEEEEMEEICVRPKG
jgi:short-subunit dehydrogenase